MALTFVRYNGPNCKRNPKPVRGAHLCNLITAKIQVGCNDARSLTRPFKLDSSARVRTEHLIALPKKRSMQALVGANRPNVSAAGSPSRIAQIKASAADRYQRTGRENKHLTAQVSGVRYGDGASSCSRRATIDLHNQSGTFQNSSIRNLRCNLR